MSAFMQCGNDERSVDGIYNEIDKNARDGRERFGKFQFLIAGRNCLHKALMPHPPIYLEVMHVRMKNCV